MHALPIAISDNLSTERMHLMPNQEYSGVFVGFIPILDSTSFRPLANLLLNLFFYNSNLIRVFAVARTPSNPFHNSLNPSQGGRTLRGTAQ